MARSATLADVLVVLIGAGLLALFAWCWLGRARSARWWATRRFGPQLVLGVIPGLGLIVVAAGVLTLAGTGAALPLTPLFLAGAVLELAGIFDLLPHWWGPAWYRSRPRGRAGNR